MKQNKYIGKTHISVMKRAFSIIAIVAIVASMYTAFAVNRIVPDQTQIYTGEFAPIPYSNNATYSTGIALNVYTPTNGLISYTQTNNESAYMFVASVGNTRYFISDTIGTSLIWIMPHGESYSATASTLIQYNDKNLYYHSAQYGAETQYPENFRFETTDNLYQAVIDSLESSNGADGSSIEYTLPAGNVAFVEVANLFDGFYLATTQPFKSGLDSIHPFFGSSQVWGMTDELPTIGTNIEEFVNGSIIEWRKGTSVNILGQTDSALYTGEGPFPNKKYLVIINPMYANYYEGTNPLNNNYVLITVDQAKSLSVYSLTTTSTIESGMVTNIQTIVTGGEYQGEITGEPGENGTISWTDPDGGSTEPSTGTGNVESTGVGPFQSWLQGILEKIVEVFQPAHNAITTLSQSVTNFGSWMRALYIWLPAPILNLLTSAITLAIVIGVIKVFI